MKKLKSMFCVIFGFVFAIGSVGCGATGNGNGEELKMVDKTPLGRRENAICNYSVGETGYDLIKDGQSEYTIVYPTEKETESLMTLAVSELRNFMKEATGVQLAAKTDLQKTSADKIISLGFTEQMTSNTAVMQKYAATDVKEGGFMIYTAGNSVYIMGNATASVLWGVYEFLHQQVNYAYYAEDCYTIDKDVNNLKLKCLDIVDVPDVQYRVAGNGDDMIDTTHMRRMRYNIYGDAYINNVAFMHNYFDFIPKSEYSDKTDWFSTDGEQLCFTRDFDGLLAAVTENMIEKLEADSNHDYVPFCLNDGGSWCSCASCWEKRGLYESDNMIPAVVTVRFMNALAKNIKEWNQSECPNRDIKIVFISYGQIQNIPVKTDENGNRVTDENGNYLPYDDSWVLEDNLVLQIACSDNVMDIESVYQLDKLKLWRAYTDKYFFWCYSTTFSTYMVPFNCLETRGELYGYYVDLGGNLVFDNARYDSGYSSDWGTFKSYVYAQSLWNTNADMQIMIDDFFDNYYQEASSVMKDMLADYRSYTVATYQEKGVGHYIHGANQILDKSIYPYQTIKRYLGYIDRAYAAIADVKISDLTRYEQLRTRIMREAIVYRYLEIYLYPETFSETELAAAKTQLIKDCYTAGIGAAAEHSAIGNLF